MPNRVLADCYQCQNVVDITELEPFGTIECPECGAVLRAKVEFGAYTLRRQLTVGGMSVVFIAEDQTLGREVVVKILNREYSQNEVRMAAFEHEARVTAAISHPHVVRVLTTGRAFGRFFIAMEYVTGGHLEDRIHRAGRLPELEALQWAKEVAEGLRAAHHAGLIHRDVKPGNILIDAHGRAKIVDFGLALVTQGGKAKASEIWATPYYVPPETIEGGVEDFRSDIYAFGATFYHALAGVPPCAEESMDKARLRRAKQAVQPLGKAFSQLTPETCEMIDRCMSYDPTGRYDSYQSLLRALEKALAAARSRPITPTVPLSVGPSREARRAPRRKHLVSLLLAALVILAAMLWWLVG